MKPKALPAAWRIASGLTKRLATIDQGLLAGLRAEVGQHGDGMAAQSRHQQTGQHGIFHPAQVIELAGRAGQLRQAVQGPHGQVLPLGKTDEFPRRQGRKPAQLPAGRLGVDGLREGDRQRISLGDPLGPLEETGPGDQPDPQAGRAIVLVQLLHDFFRRRA